MGVLWFIGPMPPPLNGQSNYNAILKTRLERARDVRAISTGSGVVGKIGRAVLLPFIVLFAIKKQDDVYTSPPGQMGLWLFLLCVLALRVRRIPHFLHHHSYRAINLGPTRSHKWLTRIGGNLQKHIFLSETMCKAYSALYLSEVQSKQAMVVPNAFLFANEIVEPPERHGKISVGHLSVMTREKGVDYILDLHDMLAKDDGIRFVLAGPIADKDLRQRVETTQTNHPDTLKWLGPVQGQAKQEFYEQTDVFLLPSRLIDEADPLVILEAYAAGTSVLASDTGCIRDRILDDAHLLSMDLSDDLARLLLLCNQARAHRREMADDCQSHARTLFQSAKQQGQAFMKALGAD